MATGFSLSLLLGGSLCCAVLPIAAGIQGRRWRRILEDALRCDSTLTDLSVSARFAVVKPTHLLVCDELTRFVAVPYSPYMRRVLGIEGDHVMARRWRRFSTRCVIAWAARIPLDYASREARKAACSRLPRALRPEHF